MSTAAAGENANSTRPTAVGCAGNFTAGAAQTVAAAGRFSM